MVQTTELTNLAVDLLDVHKTYGRKTHALRGINIQVRRGEVFGLLGPNGAGKSTLVRTILGELEPLAGSLQLGTGAELGYLPQHHVGAGYGLMDPDQTVLDALLEVRNLPLAQARNFLAQFLFRGTTSSSR